MILHLCAGKGLCLLGLLLFDKALNHILGVHERAQVEGGCFNFNPQKVEVILTIVVQDEVFYKVNVHDVTHLFLLLLILSLLIKHDGKDFSNVSEKILVDALVADNVRSQLLQLKLLSIFV